MSEVNKKTYSVTIFTESADIWHFFDRSVVIDCKIAVQYRHTLSLILKDTKTCCWHLHIFSN